MTNQSSTYDPAPVMTPVVVHQSEPIAVRMWPSGLGIAGRVLLVILGVLHAVACVVFLYVVYSVYSGLAELQANLEQLGNTWGGAGG